MFVDFFVFSCIFSCPIPVILLILSMVRMVQFLRAEKGSERRENLKRSFLRLLITALVLAVCFVLLVMVVGGLMLANM